MKEGNGHGINCQNVRVISLVNSGHVPYQEFWSTNEISKVA
jgi:hypothetical protein